MKLQIINEYKIAIQEYLAETMIIIIVIYYLFLGGYIIFRRKDICSPSVLFCVCQSIMFTGIVLQVNMEDYVDCKLIVIHLLSLLFFCAGTGFIRKRVYEDNFIYDSHRINSIQKIVIVFLVIISVCICFMFYYENGGNVFISSIQKYINGEAVNIYWDRHRYTLVKGVGYFSYFKGVILPILNIFLLVNRKGHSLWLFGVLLLPLTICFILGTGQRGQFALIILVLLENVYLQYRHIGYTVTKKQIIVVCMISFSLFSVLSYANNRVKIDGSIIEGSLYALQKRAFYDNQYCAVIGFRYIDSLDVTWGKDWFQMFRDMLPEKIGYILMDFQIYKVIYGDMNGTAPPCIWGSAYYNFWYFGVTVFPFLLGMIYEKCYTNFMMKPKTQLGIAINAGLFVFLGFWFAGEPTHLVYVGVPALIIMDILLNRFSIKQNSIYVYIR